MDAHRVPEDKADLPALIDRAAAGEEVVFTRGGEVIAELRSSARKTAAQEALLRLAELRSSMAPAALSSVELVNTLRDEDLS